MRKILKYLARSVLVSVILVSCDVYTFLFECRTHSCFCGTWKWMRLWCPCADAPQVAPPHIVLEASHLIGTMHFQWVRCSLLQACEMFQKSHRLLLTVCTLNLSPV